MSARGGPLVLGFRKVLTLPPHTKSTCYEMLRTGRSFAHGLEDVWQVIVEAVIKCRVP